MIALLICFIRICLLTTSLHQLKLCSPVSVASTYSESWTFCVYHHHHQPKKCSHTLGITYMYVYYLNKYVPELDDNTGFHFILLFTFFLTSSHKL